MALQNAIGKSIRSTVIVLHRFMISLSKMHKTFANTAPRGQGLLTYELKHSSEATMVILKGAINEGSSDIFNTLSLENTAKPWIIHLGGIDSINSLGIRIWTNFIRKIQTTRIIAFSHCSPIFVQQMNTITSLLGAGKVESFYGAFFCAQCNFEDSHLFEASKPVTDLLEEAHQHKCAQCGELMTAEEDDELFFAFLSR